MGEEGRLFQSSCTICTNTASWRGVRIFLRSAWAAARSCNTFSHASPTAANALVISSATDGLRACAELGHGLVQRGHLTVRTGPAPGRAFPSSLPRPDRHDRTRSRRACPGPGPSASAGSVPPPSEPRLDDFPFCVVDYAQWHLIQIVIICRPGRIQIPAPPPPTACHRLARPTTRRPSEPVDQPPHRFRPSSQYVPNPSSRLDLSLLAFIGP